MTFFKAFRLSRSSFGDQILDVFLGHPYALARTGLRHEYQSFNPSSQTGKLLDVGCGSMPYRPLFTNISDYEGIEIDQPRNRDNQLVAYYYDGSTFPLSDEQYDVVFCSQVLEHSFDPRLLLSEISRVLKHNGTLFLSIPFIWPEHEQPYDSQRLTSFGLDHLLKLNGFNNIVIRKVNPGLACLSQLLIEYLESIKRLHVHPRLYRLWDVLFFLPYALLNICGYCYRAFVTSSNMTSGYDLYLDLVVTAVK